MKRPVLVLTLLVQVCLSGCASMPWEKYPIAVPPDYTCLFGGGETAFHVYVWKCLDGQRVVVKQYGAFLMLFAASKYEASCGDKTEFEKDGSDLDPEQRQCKVHLEWKVRPN